MKKEKKKKSRHHIYKSFIFQVKISSQCSILITGEDPNSAWYV